MNASNVLLRTSAMHDQNLALATDLVSLRPQAASELLRLINLGVNSPLEFIARATARQIEDVCCMACIGLTEATMRAMTNVGGDPPVATQGDFLGR